MWKPLLVILIVVFSYSNSFSQSFAPNSSFISHWQIQADAGTSLFFGDIKQYQWWPVSTYENEWRMAFGLQLNKQISPIFGIRGQGLYGKLAGTRRARGKHFENDYFEFNLNTTININNIFARYRHDRLFNAYVIIGVGLLHYNTRVYELGTNKLLQKIGEGGGSGFGGRTLEGIFMGGIGFDFRLSDRFNIKLETANRIMNSDMLDGQVSGFKYDVYNLSTIGISYKFGFSKKHQRSENIEEKEPVERTSRKIKEVETVEYDYGQPIENTVRQVDAMFMSPNIVTQPIKADTVTIIHEEPGYVETVIEETVVAPEVVYVLEEDVTKDFEYRVQIRAKQGNPISISHLSNTYNIPQSQIRQNTHNGYYIYSVGSFSTYEQARSKRNELRSYNGISDAFVVAFKNGSRLDKLP